MLKNFNIKKLLKNNKFKLTLMSLAVITGLNSCGAKKVDAPGIDFPVSGPVTEQDTGVTILNGEYECKSSDVMIIDNTILTSDIEVINECENIKNMIKNNSVNGTICIDMDCLIETNGLDNAIKLGQLFVKGLEENRIFVTIMVSTDNYETIKNNFTNSDICLSLSNEDTNNIQTGSVYFRDTNELLTTIDYKGIINNANLNNADNFIDDIKYTVVSGDALSLIAQKYSISVSALKMYNNLNTDVIKVGQVLNIPGYYSVKENTDINNNIVDTNKYYKGIDVSEFQGYINWEETSKYVDFAIIRVADAYNKDANGNIILDKQFIHNISECNRLGIPCGVYIYTRAIDEDSLNKEIKFVLDSIKDYDVVLPIYRDVEGKYAESVKTSNTQVDLTLKFCEKIEKAGYPTGVYIHMKYLPYIKDDFKEYSTWAQGGAYYNSKQDFESMEYAVTSDGKTFNLDYTVNIFQPTQAGNAHGIGITDNTAVDFDYVDKAFVDALIKKFGKDAKVKIKIRN